MVCAELGIPNCDFTNNAAYLSFWLEKLRSDRKEIFRAAADAQRIADYLLAFHPEYAARAEPSVRDGSEHSSDTANEDASVADLTVAA